MAKSEELSASTCSATKEGTTDGPSITPPKKKKKKKASYKNMMAGVLEGDSKNRDIEKEKERLKKVTGGGHFQKIDKI